MCLFLKLPPLFQVPPGKGGFCLGSGEVGSGERGNLYLWVSSQTVVNPKGGPPSPNWATPACSEHYYTPLVSSRVVPLAPQTSRVLPPSRAAWKMESGSGQSERPRAENLIGVLPNPLDSIPAGLSGSPLPSSHRLPPAFPSPHTFYSGSAQLCFPAPLRGVCLLPFAVLGSASLIKQVSLLPPTGRSVGPLGMFAEALRPEPSYGGKPGGRQGAGKGGRLLYSQELAIRGLGVRNSFVQPSPSLCPSSCSPPSHCQRALSWFWEARAEGIGGREDGGGDHTILQLGSEEKGPCQSSGNSRADEKVSPQASWKYNFQSLASLSSWALCTSARSIYEMFLK